MKTKQEVIKQAYGEYWETVKVFIDENGWFSINGFMPNFIEDFDEIGYGQTKRIRPKSLQGIENNNGWIKIESEKDLPINTIEYHVIINGSLEKAYYRGYDRWIVQGNDYPKTTEIHGITHYQPIQKPQPPIY